jgi:general secretion pathway protein K
VALIRLYGPLTDLTPLGRAGLDPAIVARLSALVTALPYDSKVNLNAVSEPLLAILLDDPAAARRLIVQRQRRGFLTAADLAEQGVTVPPGTGFASDLFWVTARARIGDTGQRMTSLLARRRLPDGSVRVMPVGRWLGANAAG